MQNFGVINIQVGAETMWAGCFRENGQEKRKPKQESWGIRVQVEKEIVTKMWSGELTIFSPIIHKIQRRKTMSKAENK